MLGNRSDSSRDIQSNVILSKSKKENIILCIVDSLRGTESNFGLVSNRIVARWSNGNSNALFLNQGSDIQSIGSKFRSSRIGVGPGISVTKNSMFSDRNSCLDLA